MSRARDEQEMRNGLGDISPAVHTDTSVPRWKWTDRSRYHYLDAPPRGLWSGVACDAEVAR